MKMRVTGRCSVRGNHVEPGTIVDIAGADALNLLACGRGEALNPADVAAAVRESNAIAAELERQNRCGFAAVGRN